MNHHTARHIPVPQEQPTNSLIPIAKPLLGEEETAAVARVMRSGWVSQGPEVAAFEKEFAVYCGAKHACAVANCTAALHMALAALDVGPGDEVVTVSHSFIATANAVRYVGATPVFVDVDPINGNMLAERIEAACSPSTKALLVVHQLGMPCDMPTILAVAVAHGIPVIEDAACAVGSEILVGGEWQAIGRPHGTIACFSFHPRKVLTTGDGGMLTTNDPDIDRRFRLLRQHGMSVSDRERHASNAVVFESYDIVGFNYRMTDIQAAVGRVQLERLPGLIKERRAAATEYGRLLADIPGLGRPAEPSWARSNWQTYFVRLPAGIEQGRFMQAMLDAGVSTRRGVMCTHREPAYAAEIWRSVPAHDGLRNGEELQDRGVALPLFPGISHAQQSFIANQVKICLALVSSARVSDQ